MGWETVEYACGHKLVDNSVGDYNLICPTLGDLRFVHLGLVAAIDAGEATCSCGQRIGSRVSGELLRAARPDLTRPPTPLR